MMALRFGYVVNFTYLCGMEDLNSNSSVDPQLQEFIKYFDRMEREAPREDYKHMLEDIRDTCINRLKALKRED